MDTYFDNRGLPAFEIQLMLFDLPGRSRKGFTWETLLSLAEDEYLDGKKEDWRRRYTEIVVHESFKRAFHSSQFKHDRAEYDEYESEGRCWVCREVVGYRADDGSWYPCLELGHLIDRAMGGSNLPNNLRPMCGYCNKVKPLHGSMTEVLEWREQWLTAAESRPSPESESLRKSPR